MPMTDKQLASRDAKRNLGAELLHSVREMKAGKGKAVARVEIPAVTPMPARNPDCSRPSSPNCWASRCV